MNVRTYEERDHQEVVVLWREVFGYDTPHNDPELSLRNKTAARDGLLFVAEEEGRTIGTVMGGYDGHRGWIYSLAVSPEHRRTGAGRLLVEAVVQELAARGCVKVNLQVTGDNRQVVGFYEKLGFSVEDRISMGLKLFTGGSARRGA